MYKTDSVIITKMIHSLYCELYPMVLPGDSVIMADLMHLGFDEHGASSWRFSHTSSAGLAIREAGADGLGVFALHAVRPGERLLAERPLLSWRGKDWPNRAGCRCM